MTEEDTGGGEPSSPCSGGCQGLKASRPAPEADWTQRDRQATMLRVVIFYFMIFYLLCCVFVATRRLSLVVACGLRYPTAGGISVPQPGIKPAFLVLEGAFLTIEPPGKS